jgi:hypothetical protein
VTGRRRADDDNDDDDDNNIAEDCVELNADNSDWNYQNCENNHMPFICEMQ